MEGAAGGPGKSCTDNSSTGMAPECSLAARNHIHRYQHPDLLTSGLGVLSTQGIARVLQRLRPALTPKQARQVVQDYSEWCRVDTDPLLIISASHQSEQHSINFWDALIIEAALRIGGR